ncbi:flagellar protein FlaG [Noviherbaspirillum saxi]|uniref:Flagellar biosynthesis protein FlaG n=1 Tax=Noviherbaspirillum saxi TaxID=2320863 RepID=A0A3A3G902_9BURK|nr:flagellar protein FlaG [Noviherbaspirillum saxi]RJF98625.1 flagellar biosynthesis protein FlaG [Noviherbaspirillum saxi]
MDISVIGNNSPPGAARSEGISAAETLLAARSAAATVQTAAAVEQPATVPSLGQVSQALKSINKALEERSQSLEFALDEDTDRTVVKVLDRQTKEVIRQMPTEEALRISKTLDQSHGLLIRQKA